LQKFAFHIGQAWHNKGKGGVLRHRVEVVVTMFIMFPVFRMIAEEFTLCKSQNPLHQFPRSKAITSWRGQKSVVSVVWRRFQNSITTTCCQQVGNFPVYGKVTGKSIRNGFEA